MHQLSTEISCSVRQHLLEFAKIHKNAIKTNEVFLDQMEQDVFSIKNDMDLKEFLSKSTLSSISQLEPADFAFISTGVYKENVI